MNKDLSENDRIKAEAQQKVRDAQDKDRVAEQEWIAKAAKQRAKGDAWTEWIAEAAKERAKEEAAKKNREIQARVHNEMAKAISDATGVDCGVARKVVKAIAKGQVPHVKVSYL